MSLNVTHTFATLEVSERTFREIKRKLKKVKYDHMFVDKDTIYMGGIGIVPHHRKKKKR